MQYVVFLSVFARWAHFEYSIDKGNWKIKFMSLFRAISKVSVFLFFNSFLGIVNSAQANGACGINDSLQVKDIAARVIKVNDNKQRPFIVVDKKKAEIYAFDSGGILLSKAPILLGMAIGDDLPIEIARLPLSQIKQSSRITPAGRYIAELGKDTHGKDVLWVDYAGNLAIHPVINVPRQDRLERLNSKTIEDNRISWGCINVPKLFFKNHILNNFSRSKGMVYILPEVKTIKDYLWFEK